MNLERIIRITSFYYLLTGYQIHWFDRKTLRYNPTLWCFMYFLILSIIYLICFAHHFENSSLLKIISDLSPFLRNLVRFHVLLSLKAIVFFISEWKHRSRVISDFMAVLDETLKNKENFDQQELLAYAIFFSTFIVFCGFGLYIAVELNFELPPIDHIMINMALFLPHFIIAGCLRFHSLGSWLLKRELLKIEHTLKDMVNGTAKNTDFTVIEISNPAFDSTTHNRNILLGFYAKLSQRVALIANYLQTFDSVLQRQLSILISLNFNCLLAGFYSRLYFETSWHVLFTNRNRRIFYAANSAIFACILMDYGVLLFSRWCFCKEVSRNYFCCYHNFNILIYFVSGKICFR